MAVLYQLDQEAAVVVGDDMLREALILLVDRIVIFAAPVDRTEKAFYLSASNTLDMRARGQFCHVGRRRRPLVILQH